MPARSGELANKTAPESKDSGAVLLAENKLLVFCFFLADAVEFLTVGIIILFPNGLDLGCLIEEVEYVAAQLEAALVGVHINAPFGNFGYKALCAFLHDKILDVVGAAFLFALAKIADSEKEEDGAVAVTVGEFLAKVVAGLYDNSCVGVAETDILDGDNEKAVPHFFFVCLGGNIKLVSHAHCSVLVAAADALLQSGDYLVCGQTVLCGGIGPGIVVFSHSFYLSSGWRAGNCPPSFWVSLV